MLSKVLKFAIAGLIISILVAVFYFLFVFDFGQSRDQGRPETTYPNQSSGNSQDSLPSDLVDDQPSYQPDETAVIEFEEPKAFDRNDLGQMATSFAERFGSYSNQSNFSNIKNLKIFMTAKMKKWADEFIEQEYLKERDAGLYYGITTKAAAHEVVPYDEGSGQAVVTVSTRRREATGTTSNLSNVFSQDLKLIFVKEKGVWKVDSALWLD